VHEGLSRKILIFAPRASVLARLRLRRRASESAAVAFGKRLPRAGIRARRVLATKRVFGASGISASRAHSIGRTPRARGETRRLASARPVSRGARALWDGRRKINLVCGALPTTESHGPGGVLARGRAPSLYVFAPRAQASINSQSTSPRTASRRSRSTSLRKPSSGSSIGRGAPAQARQGPSEHGVQRLGDETRHAGFV
jgi:hypothetical protein